MTICIEGLGFCNHKEHDMYEKDAVQGFANAHPAQRPQSVAQVIQPQQPSLTARLDQLCGTLKGLHGEIDITENCLMPALMSEHPAPADPAHPPAPLAETPTLALVANAQEMVEMAVRRLLSIRNRLAL